MRTWQIPNVCTDLAVYDEELDTVVGILRQELGYDRLVVMAIQPAGSSRRSGPTGGTDAGPSTPW